MNRFLEKQLLKTKQDIESMTSTGAIKETGSLINMQECWLRTK